MSRALFLEEFDDAASDAAVIDLSDGFSTGGRLAGQTPPPPQLQVTAESDAAYERGYQAGWDDCEQRQQADRSAVGAELARNVQELGFTYHEARAHVLSGIEPLLRTLVAKVLPDLVTATLGQSIVEELVAIAETAADAPLTILVSPESHDMVAGFMDGATALPYRLVSEPTLGEWQVFFRLGDHERQLDMTELLGRITDRLSAFTDQNQKVLKHG